MKKAILLMAVVLFGALAMGQTTLTLSDYWIYWMTPQGTVLGGFTIDGNFATRGNVAVGNALTVSGATTLSGALGITGDTTITGDLTVTGTLTASSGLTWTPPLVVGGAIYHTGATNSGALMVSSNTLAYTDTTAKNLFVLPANAIVTDVVVVVTTACNGDGTHQLSVGITGETTKWVNALDVKSSTGVFRMGSSGAMPFAGIGTVGGTAVTVIGSIPAGGTAGDAGSVTVYIYWYLAP